MLKQLANIMSYVSVLSALVPIMTFLIYRSNYKIAVITLILVMFSFTSDISNEYFVRTGNQGFGVINTYFIIQFGILSLIYHQLLNKTPLVRTLFIIYSILMLVDIFAFKSFNEFQNWIRLFECLSLMLYSYNSYTTTQGDSGKDSNQHYLIVWINLAVLFYSISNLYLFFLGNYIFKELFREDAMVIWGFHSINNIVKNIFFAIALFEAGRRTRIIRENIN